MDKRYQVFLSSTFIDLEEERKEVISALQKAGYFVAGMEIFPSDDDESWDVITRVIDQSDYYVLVIAGRYGSPSKGGKSFTEREYDYAREKRLPVLAFLHGDPGKIPSEYVDVENKEKLDKFKAKVEKAHSRRTWTNKHELATEVLASLSQTINLHPRVGWVRGTAAEEKSELAQRLGELQIKYERIREERDELQKQLGTNEYIPTDLAQGTDEVRLTFSVGRKSRPDFGATDKQQKEKFSVITCWDRIFELLAPSLLGWKTAESVVSVLSKVFVDRDEYPTAELTSSSRRQIRSQFVALGLIVVEMEHRQSHSGYLANYEVEVWRLSEYGLHYYSLQNAVRRNPAQAQQENPY